MRFLVRRVSLCGVGCVRCARLVRRILCDRHVWLNFSEAVFKRQAAQVLETSARNFKNSAIKFLPLAAFVPELLRRNLDASCDEILKFRSEI